MGLISFRKIEKYEGACLLGGLLQDARYALRIAGQNPGSTLAAFLALALGIGATTAIFSVVYGVIFRPLPVRDVDRVVRIFESDSRSNEDDVSMADYLDWKRQLRSFESLALYADGQANLTGLGTPERVLILACDSGLLPLLGVVPVRGRNFTPEEDQPGHDQVALLTWSFWRSHFGGRNPLGDKILLDDKPHTIIGVLPRDFFVMGEQDVLTPVSFDFTRRQNTRGYHWYGAMGRLRPGVSLAQANAELSTAAASLAAEYPQQNDKVGIRAIPLQDWLTGNVRPVLVLLFGAVSCVLLIACGNTANLLLARASSRQREVSMRVALGATRFRLCRQLLTESVLLSCSAALAGLALAAVSVRIVTSLKDTGIPNAEEITLDWHVLVFAIATGILTGILFGFAPAIRVSGARVNDTLKESASKVTESRGQRRLRQWLVCLETAIATLLLIESGLLIKSLAKAAHIDPGFRPDHLLTLFVSLPPSRYDPFRRPGCVARFSDTVLERIRSIPGVKDAAITSALPLLDIGGGTSMLVEGQPTPKTLWGSPFVQWSCISPAYFRTMCIRMLSGRDFNEHDDMTTKRVAIVNQALVRLLFHGQNPIGKRIANTSKQPDWREVVAVVDNVPQLGLEKKALPEAFLPLKQVETPSLAIAARTEGDPLGFKKQIEAQMHALDPELAIFKVRSMQQIITRDLGWRTFYSSLLIAFASIAIILACIGIYAVIAYSVTQRIGEMGIRMAVGAGRSDILRMVLRQGVTPALYGLVGGAICSIAVGRFISQLLYGVASTDPLTYLLVVALLLGIAIAASFFPALHAASVDPSQALRYQ